MIGVTGRGQCDIKYMPIQHKISSAATSVITRLHEAGYETYLVGGAVRDLLLDLDPKDYDVATSATPEEVKELFGRQARLIGRRFRLAHVYYQSDIIEVSTFRREPSLQERKGRQDDKGLIVWRDNEFGTLEEDARRRDFTVNAIYYNPLMNDGEKLVDFVGGLDDMKQRTVRAIGLPDIRMQEDPVRMLRACKLVAQYNFDVEEELGHVLSANASQLELSSQARLLEEIFKILKKPYCWRTLQVCHRFGLLRYLLPAIGDRWESESGLLCQHLLQARDELMLRGKVYPSRVTGLAALLLPFVADACGTGQDLRDLWENTSGINKVVRSLTHELLEPYRVPRHTIAKICDTLLVQPKFLEGQSSKRVVNHPEYNRGRDLFQIFVQGAGLSSGLLSPWPNQQKTNKRRYRRRKQRSGEET